MKKIIVLITMLVLITGPAVAQDVFGLWRTIDDNTGTAKSHVEIYEKNGKVYGKVKAIMNPEKQDVVCDNCEGADKDKPVIGLVIIRELEKDGSEYNDGKILDPETGKLYKCYIELQDDGRLKVRGYIGFSLLGRTQYWERIK